MNGINPFVRKSLLQNHLDYLCALTCSVHSKDNLKVIHLTLMWFCKCAYSYYVWNPRACFSESVLVSYLQ